ncbi:polyphosphate kinase 1 [Leptolyngbya sp. PCC 6406]|uniref:polyphosphate kinase 1 n=1 Tax=Leptolyngbya sp. PCC 6406 TaxID=1173264 RepID=UPI0002AC255E|nr:polyphosphate kinase 1 [Leptolyngbya sp. PCC 6406]
MAITSAILASGQGYLNRELSWIALYRRLLYEAADFQRSPLERLAQLAQVSLYIDDYFMVRGAALKQAIALGLTEPSPDGIPPREQLQRLRASLLPLLQRQQAHFASSLQPALATQGIVLQDYIALNPQQRGQLQQRFEEEISPLLGALVVPPGQGWPEFSNLSLTLAVGLQTSDGEAVAWVKVPRSLARFVAVEPRVHPWVAVPLEQAIAAHLPSLFPRATVRWAVPLRVTRSANLDLDDGSDTENLMDWVAENLQQRQQQGNPVRLEVGGSLPPLVASNLLATLGLEPMDLYVPPGWLAYGDLMEVAELWSPPRPDCPPVLPPGLAAISPKSSRLGFPPPSSPIFQVLQQRDILVHLPYHSFAATVEQFVADAATDPQVLAIKMTLYRTAGDGSVVRSLLEAAKEGKQVVVLVELTAPLEEETNIHWARRLEKAGAHVVYGVVGLKTHTNLVLVVRRERSTLRRYAYIGTGDYLPHRPQPYVDLGLLTSQPDLGQDLSHLFNFLTGYSRHQTYQHLLVAPVALRSQLMALIQAEVDQVRAGGSGRLIAKMNVLADPAIITALYHASQAGVEIDLIVRGVCCLRPGVAGISDRIRVVSILGRYVEHSRILYCQNGHQPLVYIGSADWTPRGLDQRIEVLAPILAPEQLALVQQLLEDGLADNQNAWLLQPDGRYLRRRPQAGESPFSTQARSPTPSPELTPTD